MKKKVLIFSAVAGVLLLGGGALALHMPRPEQAANLVTVPVALSDIESSVMATGNVQPGQVIDVSPRISGQLVSLTVHMGDHVAKGQVIGKVDSRNLDNDLSAAQNALRRSTAQRSSIQITLIAAANEQARQHALFDVGVSSQSKVDTADDAVRRGDTNLRNAELQIQNAQIDIDQANAGLEKANVVAPIDGVVAEVLLREGSTMNLARQQPVILRIAQMQSMTVRAQVSEADIPKIEQGQAVYFTILGDTRHRYYGALRAVSFTPSTGSLTPAREGRVKEAIYYDALFEVPNMDGRLLPGMTANVHVVLGTAKQAMSIPVAALGRSSSADHYTVRVQDSAGKVTRREIVAGLSDRINIEVKSGLKSGEKVVVGEEPPTAAS